MVCGLNTLQHKASCHAWRDRGAALKACASNWDSLHCYKRVWVALPSAQ
jgi:hypothetical protein